MASRYNVAKTCGEKSWRQGFKSRGACPGSPTPWRVCLQKSREPDIYNQVSLGAQTVKNPPAMQETRLRSLSWEDPLEEETATHPSILAWRIPWMEEPGGHSPWGHKESDMTRRLTHRHTHHQEACCNVAVVATIGSSLCVHL